MAIDPKFVKQEPMEIESIPLDPERLEVVKEILAQNRMILEMILEPAPRLHLFNNINREDWSHKVAEMMRNNG